MLVTIRYLITLPEFISDKAFQSGTFLVPVSSSRIPLLTCKPKSAHAETVNRASMERHARLTLQEHKVEDTNSAETLRKIKLCQLKLVI